VERQRLEAALREEGWADHTSIARELDTWTQLAVQVDRYGLTVDDYTNDLCSRDYLAEVTARASAELRAAISGRLAAADDRFRASTVEDTDHRLGRWFRIGPDRAWWWHRRPSSGPLADFLAEPG
jgi:hypothetical protein